MEEKETEMAKRCGSCDFGVVTEGGGCDGGCSADDGLVFLVFAVQQGEDDFEPEVFSSREAAEAFVARLEATDAHDLVHMTVTSFAD